SAPDRFVYLRSFSVMDLDRPRSSGALALCQQAPSRLVLFSANTERLDCLLAVAWGAVLRQGNDEYGCRQATVSRDSALISASKEGRRTPIAALAFACPAECPCTARSPHACRRQAGRHGPDVPTPRFPNCHHRPRDI